MTGAIRIGVGGWTFEPWRGVFYPEGLAQKRELESVKGSRFCTNRKILAGAGEAVERFIAQGLTELGDKLGPINWQFMATKKFDPADFGAFLALLPREKDGIALRHAVEVRHPTFATAAFYDLARKHGVAIVYAKDEDFPEIDQPTAGFTYARLMASREDLENGVSARELAGFAKQARAWAQRGDVFAYFISGAKVRNPAAAQALIKQLG
ncbi:MAG: DUF72 domain-containing protein [Roseiarcus sp.]